MEYVQTQNKIRLLFRKILEPGYVMDNYYADQLIDKMRNCADDPGDSPIIYIAIY